MAAIQLPLSAEPSLSAGAISSSPEIEDFRGDLPIVPNGETTDPGWALARLNSGGSPFSASSYLYPETNTPVRLYLIDTAVDNSSGWFDANPNISITTELISYGGGPTTSSAFEHGTRMMGIIAGPETGTALGTPIEVINYDIYPNGEGSATSSGLLAGAIDEAVFHQLFNPDKPAIICIAAGSAFAGTSGVLESAVDFAVSEGIPVIVSAGNSGQLAGGFVPAAYGAEDGVICVGASNSANARLSISNYGPAVDLYAPGQNVKTVRVSSPASGLYDTSTGTSPAAAMTAGAALATLSMHPEFTPAELEASLKASTYSASVDLVQLPPIDSDGDGSHDVLETFGGSDPLSAEDSPARPSVSGSSEGGATLVSLSFAINASLFDSDNPSELSNGITWKVKESSDTKNWTDSTGGSFSYGTASNGIVPVTYTQTCADACCFLKLEITPAP